MKKTLYLIPLIALMLFIWHPSKVVAQGSGIYGSGLKLSLDSTGSKYVRFIFWNQFWTRYINNNPNTIVNGESAADSWDIGLRRSRMLAYAQISPRFLIMFHVGINNQTALNGGGSGSNGAGLGGYGAGKKPQLFVHDAWTEYAIVQKKLHIGTGLHYWNGISRMSNASTLNFLTIDAPIFNWPLIELSDQFARQFGIYAKGELGKFSYQVALNNPFSAPNPISILNGSNAASAPAGVDIARDAANNSWASSGYFTFQFLDKESSFLPYRVGTYVGTKKVFNIGAGYHIHPNATASTTARDINGEATAVQRHNMNLFGIDLFLDHPFGGDKNMAITAYSVLYNYDFGPNYLRNVGIMNIASSGGNAQPTIGTGTIFYTQAGFLLPKNTLGKVGRLQPFAAYTYKDFEALQESSSQFDIGANLHLEGHHSKVTLQYSQRPVYGADGRLNPDKKSAGEVILQTMLYF